MSNQNDQQGLENYYPAETNRPVTNDSIAAKRGRARKQLQEMLPPTSAIAALEVHARRDVNGNMIREFYLFTVRDYRVVLLNPFLRELGGFGVNRKRGTIRTQESWDELIEHVSRRLYGYPTAFEPSLFYPTL
jgi:hypothetical protein